MPWHWPGSAGASACFDADIYGPSVPKIFGVTGKPRLVSGRTLEPMEAYGLKLMSIGFLIDESAAMIWRGPMVISAITQMLREVAWGELDVLVVDMPPGTGDAQLTMAQQTPLAGAVIVSTPQDLALLDARRGVAMFQKVSVPILGIIENMSYFIAPILATATTSSAMAGRARRRSVRASTSSAKSRWRCRSANCRTQVIPSSSLIPTARTLRRIWRSRAPSGQSWRAAHDAPRLELSSSEVNDCGAAPAPPEASEPHALRREHVLGVHRSRAREIKVHP